MSPKTIMIKSDDIPTKGQMLHAYARLIKDYEILKRSKGTKDIEDPIALLSTASFIDMLVRREGKKLRDEVRESDDKLKLSIVDQFKMLLFSIPKEEADTLLANIAKELQHET